MTGRGKSVSNGCFYLVLQLSKLLKIHLYLYFQIDKTAHLDLSWIWGTPWIVLRVYTGATEISWSHFRQLSDNSRTVVFRAQEQLLFWV